MAQLAGPEELQTFLALESVDDDRLEQAVTLASGAVQAYCGQRLALVEDDELTISGSWDRELNLPERPVVDVSSVTVARQALDSGIYMWNRQGRLVWSPPQEYSDWDSALTWGGPLVDVVVVYTHGYAIIPDEVKLATLRVAARIFQQQPGEPTSETIGSYGETMNSGAEVELIDSEKRLLRRYRRSSASVPIG